MASLQGDSAAADLDSKTRSNPHVFIVLVDMGKSSHANDSPCVQHCSVFLAALLQVGKNALTSLEATFREAMIEFGLLLQSRGDPGAVEYFRKAAMNKNVCLG